MSPTTVELLRDILREAEFLSVQAGQTTCMEFLHDEVLKRAFVRSLEVIGEATKKVPEETRLVRLLLVSISVPFRLRGATAAVCSG